MTAKLPWNYSRHGEFPLLVHLSGGSGSPGTRGRIAHIRKLTGGRDFIAVTLPLFKKAVDPDEVADGLLLGAYDDYPLIFRCYRKMLKELMAAVPNISAANSCLGGFANGAHTTALLVSGVGRFILRHFGSFYLLEGGFRIASFHKRAVRSKRFLYMVGGSRRKKMRRTLLQVMDSMETLVKGMPLDVTIVKMPGVEHAFPEEHIPLLHRWLCEGIGVEPSVHADG